MRTILKTVTLSSILMLGLALSSTHFSWAGAQDEIKSAKSARGGLLVKSEHNQFEVFFYPVGLRLFPQDSTGAPVDISKLTGTATFYHPNSPKPWFIRPLRIENANAEMPQGSLVLSIDLSTVPAKEAKVTFEIGGLAGSGSSIVVATVPVEFVVTSEAAPAMGLVTPSPRYVYGPGYYGYGYYQYPGSQTAPAPTSEPTVYSYSTPSSRSYGGSSGSTHDYSTGRDLPSGGLISKPWLRPMD